VTAAHGGDLNGIARRIGGDAARLLDFSANINPLGPPAGVIAALHAAASAPQLLGNYPDPYARELVARIAAREGVARGRIIVGNGGAALLHAAVRALQPQRPLLPRPAFSEYARVLATAPDVVTLAMRPEQHFRLDPADVLEAAATQSADAVVFSNPHNPSGTMLPRAEVLALVRGLARMGCATIVDEAFIDYMPGESIAAELSADEPVVVLRSLTKFYAMPGLRIGYAFAGTEVAARMRAALPSWPTGFIEQSAAVAALSDPAYDERTRAVNADERTRLAAGLAERGMLVAPASANYLLADVRERTDDAVALAEGILREYGIVLRSFDEEPALTQGYLRLAVRARADNARLLQALDR
jgi:threonine-phosphate decarboxylase